MTPRFVDRPTARGAVITGGGYVVFMVWVFAEPVADGEVEASEFAAALSAAARTTQETPEIP